MLRPIALAVACLSCLSLVPGPSLAHFGAVIPSDDIITKGDPAQLSLRLSFLHPQEGQAMELARPEQIGMLHRGVRTDLGSAFQANKEQGFTSWQGSVTISRPGDYTFFMVPTPYWEPSEDVFIIHSTKVCVNAFGLEQGWDQPVGLETEIIPLSRPYGLWTNNLFTGQVLLKGKPVPFAEVEVEYLNASAPPAPPITPPSSPFITQVVKADGKGVFSYAMVKAGWWGFAALSEDDRLLEHDGVKKKVELGAVYWVHATDLTTGDAPR
ncbi:DUF4198 domain-containing protein [Desulfogranum mediterraneum]|uniref:DUF4198 domain-containing protein n=1 Tax=Desulfogranum mediterraneum TaxID=160661 RepID=UPI00041304F4|nr:DUF4198 domain-containing protein [Desulfogranum mediterraneum]